MPIDQGDADEALAQRAATGSRAAFAELVARHGRGVTLVLRQAVRDEHLAEDLAQEVWIKVHGALGRFRPGSSFRSWLYAIALNHMRDALRSARRDRLELRDDLRPIAPPVEPSAEPEVAEQRRQVEAALAQLREEHRVALGLIDLAGLGYAEAAASIGCSLGTLKSRVHRARAAFRETWARREAAASTTRHDPAGAPHD